MIKNSPTCARIALLTLSLLSGCATQTVCHRPPLKDSPAPPPEMFSKCLREILANNVSQGCLTFLQHEQTK